jgi:hypothetical protein
MAAFSGAAVAKSNMNATLIKNEKLELSPYPYEITAKDLFFDAWLAVSPMRLGGTRDGTSNHAKPGSKP